MNTTCEVCSCPIDDESSIDGVCFNCYETEELTDFNWEEVKYTGFDWSEIKRIIDHKDEE